jgi:flagellar biosynthesis/type III secretory pathway M-ring protein FliF/YscJ
MEQNRKSLLVALGILVVSVIAGIAIWLRSSHVALALISGLITGLALVSLYSLLEQRTLTRTHIQRP